MSGTKANSLRKSDEITKLRSSYNFIKFLDHLLCHDDKCEDRHIAFVLYLTENWTVDDGGNLELLTTDEKGDPQWPIVTVPATFNTLVLFEVSPTSYHQVTEVMTKTKKRLSINGWFHKSNLPEWPEGPPLCLETTPPCSWEFELNEYIFNKYLSHMNQKNIKAIFISNSEIQLDEFLMPEEYHKLRKEFRKSSILWHMVGPANIRHYEVADPSTLPSSLSCLWNLLQSRTWLRFLKNITGLDLVPDPNSDLSIWQQGVQPSCRVEVTRWLAGSYTLVHDRDPEFHTAGLDVFIRFPMMSTPRLLDVNEDGPEAGHIIYIDKMSQDEECLLHLGYKLNSLGLIYREPGTLRFTKYLDLNATPFYQIQCLYIPWTAPPDQPDLRHMDSDDEESGLSEEAMQFDVPDSEEDEVSDHEGEPEPSEGDPSEPEEEQEQTEPEEDLGEERQEENDKKVDT